MGKMDEYIEEYKKRKGIKKLRKSSQDRVWQAYRNEIIEYRNVLMPRMLAESCKEHDGLYTQYTHEELCKIAHDWYWPDY